MSRSTLRFVLPSVVSLHPSIPTVRSPPLLLPRRNPTLWLLRYRSRLAPEPSGDGGGFEDAVALFNGGEYYRCHDVLEEIWNVAEEPRRTLVHGVLQCAVGFHHLFGQNHRGAMMELGEGLSKLRKLRLEDGPFLRFEKEIAEALEFLYQTQKELAACSDDLCHAMDGSERSYQLLGSFAAGQKLYSKEYGPDGVSYILFFPNDRVDSDKALRVKLPVLFATEEHFEACDYL